MIYPSARPGWKFGILICMLLGSALGVAIPRPFAPRHQIIPATELPRMISGEVKEQVQLKSWTEADLQIDFLQLRDVQEQKIITFTSSKYEFSIATSRDGLLTLTDKYWKKDGSPFNAIDQTYGFNHSPNSWHSLSLHIEGNRSFFQLDESTKLAFGIRSPALADTLILGTALRSSDGNSSKIRIRKFSAITHTQLTALFDRLIQRICPPLFLASLTLSTVVFFSFLTNHLEKIKISAWHLGGASAGLLAISVLLLHHDDLSLSLRPTTFHNDITNCKYQSPTIEIRKTTDGREILSDPEQNIKNLAVDLSFTIDEIADSATIFQTAPGNLGIRFELSPSGQFCLITAKPSAPNELSYQSYVPALTAQVHADYRLQIKINQDEGISAELNDEKFLNKPYTGGIKISQIILGNGFDGQRPLRGMAEIRHLEYTSEPGRDEIDAVVFPHFLKYLSIALFAAHLYVTLYLIKDKKIHQ